MPPAPADRSASDRVRWAVDRLDVQPADRILETGCGHGVAVSLICERLDGGHVVAIDRSEKMIAAAMARNARAVEAGTAAFLLGDVADVDLGAWQFDKAFALSVPVFLRGDPSRELDAIRSRLVPGGRLYVLEQPPSEASVPAVAERLRAALDHPGFEVERVAIDPLEGVSGVCAVTVAI
jgi:SAM-dependent methyltransferase